MNLDDKAGLGRKVSALSDVKLIAEVTGARRHLELHDAVLELLTDGPTLPPVTGPGLSLTLPATVVDKVTVCALRHFCSPHITY